MSNINGTTVTISNCRNTGMVMATNGTYMGGIIGNSGGGTIENCVNSGLVTGTVNYIGGIAGRGANTYFKNCQNTANVNNEGQTLTNTAVYYGIGGIAGNFVDAFDESTTTDLVSKIEGCSNSGTITGTGNQNCVGGLVGIIWNQWSDTVASVITGSENTGPVKGSTSADSVNNYAGGLVGYIHYSVASTAKTLTVTISDCNNANTVTGYTAGGLVGGAVSAGVHKVVTNINESYNTGSVAAQTGAGGIIGTVVKHVTLSVADCYNIGDVSVAASSAGGLIGIISEGTSSSYILMTDFTNCYNVGTVTGTSKIGGINGEYSTSNTTRTYTNTYYLDSCVTSGAASGSTSSTVTGIASKNKTAFEYGEVTYLLNGSTSEGTLVWGQEIGTDKYPIFDGIKVYQITDCKGNVAYSNTNENGSHIWVNADCNTPKTCLSCGETEGDALSHDWVDGVCSRCNTVQNAVYQVLSYDKSAKSAIVAAPEAGTYTVVFADYSDLRLVNVNVEEVVVTEDNVNKIITVTDTHKLNLGSGDKIMLVGNLVNLTPKCKPLEITE